MKEHAAGFDGPSRRGRRATTGRTGNSRSIATAVGRLVAAWNRGDARAFGGAFARSAVYVTGAGRTVRGRASIAALVGQAVGRIRIEGRVEVHRRAGGALARFGWRSPGPRGSARGGTITCTLAREGTGWLIRRLTNEERSPSSARPAGRRG
jgi:uncharacterized protein (TIGR02246 family)